MSGPPDPHLTPAQVTRILALVEERDAVVVGGQSLNIWAMHYRPKLPALAAFEPFTSRDIDLFGTLEAAEYLADQLGGKLLIPDFQHATPNIAQVVSMLEGRRVEIDFLSSRIGRRWE